MNDRPIRAPVNADGIPATPAAAKEANHAEVLKPSSSRKTMRRAALAALVLILLASGAWALRIRLVSPVVPTIVVVPFYNETGRPELDVVARSTSDATVARLATPERVPILSVIGNADRLRRPFAPADVQGIAQQLGATWVVIGQLKTDGNRSRLIGHLIRASDMKHVWAQTFDEPAFTLDAQTRAAESIATAVSHAVAMN